MYQEILISVVVVLLIFNVYVGFVDNTQVVIFSGDIGGLLVTAIAVAVASGVTIFGSGLSDSAVRIIFISIVLLNILWSVEIYGFHIGLGLCTTLVNVFNPTDFWGLGYVLALGISFVAEICAIMYIAESA